jgi:hypothetical protein
MTGFAFREITIGISLLHRLTITMQFMAIVTTKTIELFQNQV